MNIENTKAQMRKGVLEYCILCIIANKPVYPGDIVDKLKDADLLVVEGTLYPLLTRLKNMELLTYNWQESSQGPPRKYYSLTEKGKSFLSELHSTWNELKNSVNKSIQS